MNDQAVKFWLKERNVAGILVAISPSAGTLTDYRGSLYIVRDGAAVMIGRKLQFTRNTLPLDLKREFGLAPPKAVRSGKLDKKKTAAPLAETNALPNHETKEAPVSSPPVQQETPPAKETPKTKASALKPKETTTTKLPVPPGLEPSKEKAPRPVRKAREKQLEAPETACKCPYCGWENPLKVTLVADKFEILQGKKTMTVPNPFYIQCHMCNEQIAVKLVPITTYIAHVAGFK